MSHQRADDSSPSPRHSPLNVRQFGAAGDGQRLDTAAIHAALGRCAESGGGTVWFPPGDYLCGTLRIPSNTTIQLDSGAVLRESLIDDLEPSQVSPSHSRPHLLTAEDAENIAVTGHGLIQGRGTGDNPGQDRNQRGFRTGLIFFRNCTGIRLTDIRVRHGDSWTVHLSRCADIFIRGVSIVNNRHRIGGNDGLDLNSCRNVHISDCHIEAWDDCIVLKTRDDRAAGDALVCENVVVSNCTLITGCTALKIGSESVADFRDIHFSNCVVGESSVGLGIYLLDGGTVERVSCANVSIQIVGDDRYRPGRPAHQRHAFPVCLFVSRRMPESRLGIIRDVLLRDLQVSSGQGVVVRGDPHSPIQDLSVEHLTIRAEKPVAYAAQQLPCSRGLLQDGRRSDPSDPPPAATAGDSGAYHPAYVNVSHARGLDILGLRVIEEFPGSPTARVALSLQDVDDAVVRDVRWRSPGGGAVLTPRHGDDCRNIRFDESITEPS